MSRFHTYLNIARQFIQQYNGTEPLSRYLKTQFAREKKFGSRDRKAIASCCYAYYRSWPWLGNELSDERLLRGLYLSNQDQYGFLSAFHPEWNPALSVSEKLSFLNLSPQPIDWASAVSSELPVRQYIESLLVQPGMFLRLRPGKEKSVISRLEASGIAFQLHGAATVELPAKTPVEEYVTLNRDAVVQDWSSQEVFSNLFAFASPGQTPLPVWDVCAASGGKSILLYDLLNGKVQLTVSDVRTSILHNLRKRFSEAGVNIYHCATADLTKELPAELPEQQWPLMVCDVPCSGSGTWARTPEEAVFCSAGKIAAYAQKQSAIVQQASRRLSAAGVLVYITCSVFARENEMQVDNIIRKTGLTCLQQQYISGLERGSDTMFVAYFKRQ
jgi:16S rRNA (cytosine967-C5)-methyltransferase